MKDIGPKLANADTFSNGVQRKYHSTSDSDKCIQVENLADIGCTI